MNQQQPPLGKCFDADNFFGVFAQHAIEGSGDLWQIAAIVMKVVLDPSGVVVSVREGGREELHQRVNPTRSV
jgi:hypothetical protein